MVYKRYIKKGGKVFGPYYYESYRDKTGVVRTRKVDAPKRVYLKSILIVFLAFLLISGIFFLLNSNYEINSKVIMPINEGLNEFHASKEYVGFFDRVSNKLNSIIVGFSIKENNTKNVEEITEKEVLDNSSQVPSQNSIVEEKDESLDLNKSMNTNGSLSGNSENNTFVNSNKTQENSTNVSLSENETINQTKENNKTWNNFSENVSIGNNSISDNSSINDSSFGTQKENNSSINDSSFGTQKENKSEKIILVNNTENDTFENQSIVKTIENLSTKQYSAMIGKPVKWEAKLKVKENNSNIEVRLPSNVGNISVKRINANNVEEDLRIDSDTSKQITEIEPVKKKKGPIVNNLNFILGLTGRAVDIVEESQETIVKINESLEEGDTVVIEYESEPPYSEEIDVSETKKQIKVIGPKEIHYKNILAFSELPKEISSENNLNLFLIKNGTKFKSEFELYDSNGNGLYDYVSWVVPHLSEQDYELELKILDVQSYPSVGDFWDVEFSVVGNNNLTISPVQGTLWNAGDESDLRYVEIRCGDEVVDYEWKDNSVFVQNFSCDNVSVEKSEVLTEGKHVLEFKFGNEVAYAYNDASTSNIPQTLNLQGRLTNSSSGDALNGTYNMTFKIYDSYSGGNLLWNLSDKDVSVDSNGIYNYILEGVNLSFDSPYYLGIQVGNESSEMTPRINLSSNPYSFRADNADTLNVANNYQIQNLSLAEKITFGLGEIIKNVVSGQIDIVGNLNVSDNITADYFIGDGSYLTNLNVSFSIWNISDSVYLYNNSGNLELNETKLNETIDARGNDTNCSVTGSCSNITYDNEILGSYPTAVNLTSATYNGSIGGYSGANSICNSEFSGSHLCNEFEIMRAYNHGNVNLTNIDAWINTGGPKYVPADIPVDDCKGWTYAGTATHLGNYWHFNSTNGGEGRAINCGTELNLVCCSY